MTLDEQIKYMEQECDWYAGRVFGGRPGWSEELHACKAVLKSLKQLKGYLPRKAAGV